MQELEAQKTQAETELQNQESARTQSYNAYQSAQEQDAAAAENDQKTAEAGSYSVQSAQVDLDLARKELEKLVQVQNENGEVKAPVDGVLKKSSVTAGNVTDDTSFLMLGCGGYRIKGALTAEDLSKIEQGDEVSVNGSGKRKSIEKECRRSAVWSGCLFRNSGREECTGRWKRIGRTKYGGSILCTAGRK